MIMYSIVLAEDHVLVREGLRKSLRPCRDCKSWERWVTVSNC